MSIVKKEAMEFSKFAATHDKRGKLRLRVGTDKNSRFIVRKAKDERKSYGSIFRSVWDALISERAALPTEPKKIEFARKLILDNNVKSAESVKGSELSESEMSAVVSTALMSLFGLQFKEEKSLQVLTDTSKFEKLLSEAK